MIWRNDTCNSVAHCNILFCTVEPLIDMCMGVALAGIEDAKAYNDLVNSIFVVQLLSPCRMGDGEWVVLRKVKQETGW